MERKANLYHNLWRFGMLSIDSIRVFLLIDLLAEHADSVLADFDHQLLIQ